MCKKYWSGRLYKNCRVNTFMVIENIPNFNNDNSNQQQRFITLIDILYEKKIPLLVSSKSQLDAITSSNIKINDLYKDGLQRDQFLPFIKILKNKCFQEKLIIEEDYRKSQSDKIKDSFIH